MEEQRENSNFNFRNHTLSKLNSEQVNWLLKIISTDDQARVVKATKDCTSEVFYTRGLPLSAAVCASIYYARTKLPPQYHFGPKGWPMYLLMTFGTITLTNLLSAEKCSKRIRPILSELYLKVLFLKFYNLFLVYFKSTDI